MALPQQLLSQANCFACETPGQWQLVELSLLRSILLELNPMAQTDPATLLEQANCFACYANSPALMQLMQLVLLNQISDSISGGTGGQEVLQYVADPNAEGITPTDVNKPAVAYKSDGSGPTATWNTTTHVWQ